MPDDSPPDGTANGRVTDALRLRLIGGELRPGDMVSLRGLAQTMGVGVMPVREAVGRLVAEGALELVKNRGIRVPAMRRDRLLDLTAVRVFLETELIKRAAFQIAEPALEQARRDNDAVDAAIARGDAQGYMRANHAFHFGIYTAADSAVFQRLAETVWTQTGPFMRVVYAGIARLDYSDHHPRILDALARRDPAAASDACRADIESGLDLIARAGFVSLPGSVGVDLSHASS
jgi:DNA-binding GntR family transcriptional regulator